MVRPATFHLFDCYYYDDPNILFSLGGGGGGGGVDGRLMQKSSPTYPPSGDSAVRPISVGS